MNSEGQSYFEKLTMPYVYISHDNLITNLIQLKMPMIIKKKQSLNPSVLLTLALHVMVPVYQINRTKSNHDTFNYQINLLTLERALSKKILICIF